MIWFAVGVGVVLGLFGVVSLFESAGPRKDLETAAAQREHDAAAPRGRNPVTPRERNPIAPRERNPVAPRGRNLGQHDVDVVVAGTRGHIDWTAVDRAFGRLDTLGKRLAVLLARERWIAHATVQTDQAQDDPDALTDSLRRSSTAHRQLGELAYRCGWPELAAEHEIAVYVAGSVLAGRLSLDEFDRLISESNDLAARAILAAGVGDRNTPGIERQLASRPAALRLGQRLGDAIVARAGLMLFKLYPSAMVHRVTQAVQHRDVAPNSGPHSWQRDDHFWANRAHIVVPRPDRCYPLRAGDAHARSMHRDKIRRMASANGVRFVTCYARSSVEGLIEGGLPSPPRLLLAESHLLCYSTPATHRPGHAGWRRFVVEFRRDAGSALFDDLAAVERDDLSDCLAGALGNRVPPVEFPLLLWLGSTAPKTISACTIVFADGAPLVFMNTALHLEEVVLLAGTYVPIQRNDAGPAIEKAQKLNSSWVRQIVLRQ
ncbi:MAG: hypothetical protein AAF581_03180 [Planctomycetota bacterium]